APDPAASVLADARGALVRRGGSLVLQAAPPEVRARIDPWGPPPPSFALLRRVKDNFDPDHRLNPGRFVGGLESAGAEADRRLRALRFLPARVPDLPQLGRGDGRAARPHLPDEGPFRREARPAR